MPHSFDYLQTDVAQVYKVPIVNNYIYADVTEPVPDVFSSVILGGAFVKLTDYG